MQTIESLETTAQQVAKKFNLGQMIKITQFTTGSINQTFLIDSQTGKFVLQKIAKIFTGQITADYLFFHAWLLSRGLITPKPLITREGFLFTSDRQKNIWRAFEFIDHDPEPTKTLPKITQVAEILAKFHCLVKNCPYQPFFTLKNFHNTKEIFLRLKSIFQQTQKIAGRQRHLADSIFHEIQLILLTPHRKQQLIHGDPRFGNFLFRQDQVVALIDLDTIMLSDLRYDLGDAFRSWCHDKDKRFSYSTFDSAWSAYQATYHLPYSRDEILLATGQITLELAMRYLEDSFKQSYFSWDKEKYPTAKEHNLARCQECFSYYQSMKLTGN